MFKVFFVMIREERERGEREVFWLGHGGRGGRGRGGGVYEVIDYSFTQLLTSLIIECQVLL